MLGTSKKFVRSPWNSTFFYSSTFRFFGHNSAPSSPVYMKLRGFFSTSLPELLEPSRTSKSLRKTNLFRDDHFNKSDHRDKIVRIKPYELRRCPMGGFLHAESEFEVLKCKILHPEAKNTGEKKQTKNVVFYIRTKSPFLPTSSLHLLGSRRYMLGSIWSD